MGEKKIEPVKMKGIGDWGGERATGLGRTSGATGLGRAKQARGLAARVSTMCVLLLCSVEKMNG
jgi:hypothetical protein